MYVLFVVLLQLKECFDVMSINSLKFLENRYINSVHINIIVHKRIHNNSRIRVRLLSCLLAELDSSVLNNIDIPLTNCVTVVERKWKQLGILRDSTQQTRMANNRTQGVEKILLKSDYLTLICFKLC